MHILLTNLTFYEKETRLFIKLMGDIKNQIEEVIHNGIYYKREQ